jgi:hypothetical protein
MIYTALYVMLLMWATSISRASGRGLGPGNLDFLSPVKMAPSRRASAIIVPFPHKNYYLQGRINQRSIDSFMYMSSRAHTSALGELKKLRKGGKESATRLFLV